MGQEVLLKDVLPYMWYWTFVIALILLIQAYRLWRFGKKHPEIFQPDTTAEDKRLLFQKAEWRRCYQNQSMLSLSIAFVWIIGIVIISIGFDNASPHNQGWFLVGLSFFMILWVLSLIKRKPKE